ncbi:ROK family glucokinase [Brevibacillus fulvus]|uniref:Glucokinase n=1 Tax=Brevibacillus fulvus TaxID=1125967 RepID=A0A939BNS6_9BACL|nr:glucokinase [Brevibacillus fulvus]
MEVSAIVGVDVGGTAIKMALLSPAGEILHQFQQPTPVAQGEDGVIEKINNLVDKLLQETQTDKASLAGIGIGVPGPIDAETGIVQQAVNLGWKNTRLKEKLEKLAHVPVFVENDANAAALGEMWRGAGQGTKDLVVLTLGTGVGGGIIANGKIIHGVNGVGGEIGHMTMEPTGGPQCNCGKTGCLENYASATAIIREGTLAAEAGKSKPLADLLQKNGQLRAKDIFDAAMAGDETSIAIVDQAAFYLGLACSHLANLLNPGKIVIGGGVSLAGEFLFSRIRQHFRRYVAFPFVAESCQILPATLGNDAGVIGAGWLVRSQL